MKREELANEIKALIIEALDLEDVTVSDIETAAPLFGEGLGLDSIDALELGLALKKKYKVNFGSEQKENRKYFYSVESLLDFIITHSDISVEE